MICTKCTHNSYRGIPACEFVCCSHPVTIRKTPKPEDGDPEWVNDMTGDKRISDPDSIDECAAFEAA